MAEAKCENIDVVLAIPPLAFNHQNPKLWFSTIEAQFHCRRIRTQADKFFVVHSMLPLDIQNEVEDVLLNPPADSQYDALKAAVLGLLHVSDSRRLHQLLEGEALGDRKPSQLLTAMRRAGDGFNLDDKLLRTMWLQKLPLAAQQILSPYSDGTPLTTLASSADSICALGGQQNHVSSVDSAPDRIDMLLKQFERLSADVNRLSLESGSRHRSKSRSRSFRRGDRSASRSNGVCWYHRRYGKDARKCTTPCAFTSVSGNDSGRQ